MTVVGTTSFKYTLTDSLGRTAQATVNVTIDDALTVPIAGDDSKETNKNTAVAINVKANDTPSSADVDRISVAPAHGSAAIQADDQILYTPTTDYVGADSFKYVLKNIGGEDEATVSITVKDTTPPSNRYGYTFKPAYSLPVDANVDIWNVPVAGGTVPQKGATNKALLIVAPDSGVTGTIVARDLLYGAVFLIGATLRPRAGTAIVAPSGTAFKGHDMLQINFAAGGGVRPILWVSNIDYDPRDTASTVPDRCWWGDFCRTGTVNNGANYAEWVDVYLQKIKVKPGSYGYTGPGSDNNPRANFLHPQYGGLANAYISETDVSWQYQCIMPKNGPTNECFPDGRLRLNKVRLEILPASTAIYGTTGWSTTIQIINVTKTLTDADLTAGSYYACDLVGVYAIRNGAPGDYKNDFEPRGPPAGSTVPASTLVGNRLTLHRYKAAARALPVWTGFVDYTEPTTPVVVASEIGASNKISTKAALRALFP